MTALVRDDMEQQRFMVSCAKRRRHEEWIAQHATEQRISHQNSLPRALILIDEAYALERKHLKHQLAYCAPMLSKKGAFSSLEGRGRTFGIVDVNTEGRESVRKSSVSPQRKTDDETASPSSRKGPSCGEGTCRGRWCPCVTAPAMRRLTLRYRILNILAFAFPDRDPSAVMAERAAGFQSEESLLFDLLQQYGPEPHDVASPQLWFCCIRERLKHLDAKWSRIRRRVAAEMSVEENYPNVLRTMSIMRIFVEGNQSVEYGGDVTEKARRELHQQSVLYSISQRQSSV